MANTAAGALIWEQQAWHTESKLEVMLLASWSPLYWHIISNKAVPFKLLKLLDTKYVNVWDYLWCKSHSAYYRYWAVINYQDTLHLHPSVINVLVNVGLVAYLHLLFPLLIMGINYVLLKCDKILDLRCWTLEIHQFFTQNSVLYPAFKTLLLLLIITIFIFINGFQSFNYCLALCTVTLAF